MGTSGCLNLRKASNRWLEITRGSKVIHADEHAFAFASDGTVYLGGDGGLYRYHPRPGRAIGSWENLNQVTLNKGLKTMQLYSVDASPRYPNELQVGTQDNGGGETLDGGRTWRNLSWGDVLVVRYDPVKPTYQYHLYWDAGIYQFDSNAIKSPQKVGPTGVTAFHQLALRPGRNADMATSTKSDIYLTSHRRSLKPDWSQVGGSLDSTVLALTFGQRTAATETMRLYAGTEAGSFYALSNPGPGSTWTPLAGPWKKRAVGAIATYPDRDRASRVFVGIRDFIDDVDDPRGIGQVYYSSDGGQSFPNNITGNRGADSLPNVPVNALIVDPAFKGTTMVLYAGTDVGVYRGISTNSGTTWTWARFGDALPNVQVMDLALQSTRTGRSLIAATFGRGAWSIPVDAPPRAGVEGAAATVALGTLPDSGAPGPWTVSIEWGDDSPADTTSGSVSLAGGVLSVAGTHTWREAGDYTVHATVTSSDGQTFDLDTTVGVDDAPLSGSAVDISGTTLAPLPDDTAVATFTDANPLAQPEDFSANIDWGDGTTSEGTVTLEYGVFTVHGSHSYSNAGSFNVQVTVTDDTGDQEASITSTADISGPVTAYLLPVSATEGVDTGDVPVASFTAIVSGPFSATITWGDGSTSAGVLSFDGQTYTVTGDHTYFQAGQLPLSVTISNDSGVLAIVSGTADVQAAPLRGISLTLSAVQGVPLEGALVARLSDGNPAAQASDFSATIHWGDGEYDLTDGTVVRQEDGTFAVLGDWAYLRAGSYSATITVEDDDGTSVTITSTVSVAGAPPILMALSPAQGPAGTEVTIEGFNLFDATTVLFGSTPATFTVNDDGTITAYAPALPPGTADVTVTTPYGTSAVSDADQYTALADHAPVAKDDYARTMSYTLLDIAVLDNDTDPDGDALTVSLLSSPAGGYAWVNPDGTVSYVPSPYFSGTDSFRYQVSDGRGGTSSATVRVFVIATGPVGSLGDFVWVDSNRNGLQDADEPGLAGVTVELLTDGVVTASTTTDFSGHYEFAWLDASMQHGYSVHFLLPTGFRFTSAHAGDPALDSDADPNTGETQTVFLFAGQDETDLDAGLLVSPPPVANDDSASTPENTPVTIAVLANDTDPNGDTLTVSLLSYPSSGYAWVNPDGKVGYSPSYGFHGRDSFRYQVSDGHGGTTSATVTIVVASPTDASLGDFVWADSNGNGLQDPGEPGVAGVGVELLVDGVVTAVTTTDPSGHYLFTGLDTSTQHGYSVRFLPSGYAFTSPHAGDPALDSDADPFTGMTMPIFLLPGQTESGLDAGLLITGSSGGTGSIRGRAWADTNSNGLQEAGELGLAGLRVELHDGSGATVATTQTGQDGSYQFDGLSAGPYFLVFYRYQDYVFTLMDQGTDDTIDSDANEYGGTMQFTLGDGEIRDHLDAGLHPPS